MQRFQIYKTLQQWEQNLTWQKLGGVGGDKNNLSVQRLQNHEKNTLTAKSKKEFDKYETVKEKMSVMFWAEERCGWRIWLRGDKNDKSKINVWKQAADGKFAIKVLCEKIKKQETL